MSQHYNKDYTPLQEFKKLMFGEWGDEEWCMFDNYMINSLQLYLDKGLLQSEFVNLKTRKFVAKTKQAFVEWCGVIGTNPTNDKLVPAKKVYKQELYLDFIDDNPDFAPKSKMTISRTVFYRWLVIYAMHKYEVKPIEDRDNHGRWIMFQTKQMLEKQGDFNF